MPSSVIFSGSAMQNGFLNQAQVEFYLSGSNLTVTLTNTATQTFNSTNTLDATNVLTGVLFDIAGNTSLGALTPGNANLASGSHMLTTGPSPTTSTTDTSASGWGYGRRTNGTFNGQHYGIEAFGGFSTASLANFANSNTPPNVAMNLDGVDYGILGPGYVSGGNGGVTGMHNPYEQTAEVFHFTVNSSTFTDVSQISNVSFQYGTNNGEATFPPTTKASPTITTTAGPAVVVSPASPTITTTAGPAVVVGSGAKLTDSATLAGGFSPTGTITFTLTLNGTTVDTETAMVKGNATYSTPTGFVPTATGTDSGWPATTATATTTRSPAGRQRAGVISPASPSITTSQQPATATVGSSIADTATVSGGYNPTGTVTFNLYNNSSGTGTPLFTDTETLSGGDAHGHLDGLHGDGDGTDYWVATYNGDSNNNSVTSGTTAEPVTITPATPAINTSQQPASATVGTSIADKATVSGGYNPTGTVTFNLYNNSTGTGTPLFTDTETLSGGMATSKGYTATATGTDYWVATYNGDSNNNSVTSGTAAEPVTITPATPAINTSQQPASATVGSSIADKATVSGGYNPTGTVTFNLYNNSTASGTPLFTRQRGAGQRRGHLARLHGDRDGDRLLGRHLQRRQQQQLGHQRPHRRAGDDQPGHPGDQHQPAAGQRHRRHLDRRQGDRQRRVQPHRHRHLQPLQQLERDRHAAVHRHRDALRRGPSMATSTGYTATATGTDYWVATYNGDSNNNSVSSGTAAEPVTITPASPSINTSQQPASATVGTSIADKATVSGGYNPTGTVTFNLYNNSTATGTPLFTDTETLSGGMATSTGYTATATGTDYWVATYNGNSNNNSVSSGTAAEPVTITPASPAINTSQQPASATVGTSIADKATVSGGYNPTGTVTFNLYNNSTRDRHAAVHRHRDALRRRGHLDGLHRDGDGHRLLGRHLQRRQQQQLGHQRHRRRAGDHQPGQPGDQHQPAAGQRHRRHARSPTRPPSAAGTTRPARSPSTSTTTRPRPARRCSPTP